DGKSGEWVCQIQAINRKAVTIIPLTFHPVLRAPVAKATLALPIIKGERMDMAIQKATEMGAHRIQLIHTRYTDVRLNTERLNKKLHHWQQVIISAAEQCGLNRLPELLPVAPFDSWIAQQQTTLGLIAHPGEKPLAQLLPSSPCDFTL